MRPNPNGSRPARAVPAGLAALLAVPLAAQTLAAGGPSSPARPAAALLSDRGLVHADLARAEERSDEGIVDVVVGPVKLAAGLPHLRLPIQSVTLPIEGWLHGFSWQMVDGQGRALPDDLLHHVNLIDPDRRELFSSIARRVMAAGRETKSQSLPRLIGYPVEKGTRLLVVSMFANPTDREVPEAFLRVRLHYSRRGTLVEPMRVLPFYLDVMGPVGDKDFAVPPGRTEKYWEGSPAIDVWVLGLGGHLHDYGTELRLEDVTAGEVLWRVQPQTEGTRVVSVPTADFWWKGGLRLRRDHRYRVTVVYENNTREAAPNGGMGVVAGVVLAPGDEAPGLDRTDGGYLTDLQNMLEAPLKQKGHGGHSGHHSH